MRNAGGILRFDQDDDEFLFVEAGRECLGNDMRR